jgi:DNA-binding CsgD family transcriptional regulator
VFLGRRLERTPAMLIVTYRDDEVGADHPLRGVLGALPQGVVRRVRPQPLSEAAVAELARRAGRPAAGLRELTGGNPLLVTEVLAAGDTGVPMTVRDLVLARLAGLPADAREVARLVFAGELAFWLRLAGAPVRTPAVMAEPHRLLLAGDWRAAADAWQALGCSYQQALALSCGDQDEALLEALALLDGLGARQTAQRLRRQLRRRGTRRVPRGPTRATAANPAGLTGRQVEVLGLLAEGLTDAEIAARLSLSAKTVSHHVSALLAKLGVTSRRQAAAAARRLRVAPAKDGEPGDQS